MEKDVIILLVGIVVGAMNAIAGGGMLLGFPMLVALGVPPLVANVTANAVTPPGQLVVVGLYRDYLRRIPRRYAYLIIPIALGATAGALTLRDTNAANFAGFVPWLILFGVILFAFQPLIHLKLHHHIHHRRGGNWTLFWIGLGLLPVSFYGGYFGAGYGFMMLAFLGFGKIHEVHMLNAMKSISSVIVALICLAILHGTGLIDWRVATFMAIGTTAGGYIGAGVAKRVSSKWLRVFIVVVGLVAAAHMAFSNY
ncbi:sulfite exporter TauE/SafE family protein [Candidatus Saccharibacteria bacterium]|nr:sulfite exporter TauE/SafE family protein [Candidatus Saccharibacteria bacterium]